MKLNYSRRSNLLFLEYIRLFIRIWYYKHGIL